MYFYRKIIIQCIFIVKSFFLIFYSKIIIQCIFIVKSFSIILL